MTNKITIYSKPMCPACNTAKATLEAKGLAFEYKVLNKDYSIAEFYEIAPRSHKTFPMLTLDGVFAGTLNDLLVKLDI